MTKKQSQRLRLDPVKGAALRSMLSAVMAPAGLSTKQSATSIHRDIAPNTPAQPE
jgi:hypothetical protein